MGEKAEEPDEEQLRTLWVGSISEKVQSIPASVGDPDPTKVFQTYLEILRKFHNINQNDE